jgi:hypothetical protein
MAVIIMVTIKTIFMDRKLLFTLLLSVCSIGALAQLHDVVSASGASFKQSSGYITYTIGELVTTTLTVPGKVLTQGFLQTGLPKSWAVAVEDMPDFDLSVYPNPVNDVLYMQVDLLPGLQYTLHDVTGVMIAQGSVLDERTEIDFSYLSPAIYILRVFDNNQQIRIFQIVKH